MANEILLENFRTILDGNNFTYVDIGSRGGLSPEWEQVKSLIHVILFEPDIEEAKRLNNASSKNFKVIPKAVWSKKDVIRFNCMRNPSYSSVLTPNTKALDGTYYFSRNFYTIDEVLDIEVDTLEDVLKNFDVVQTDFLKIDIQGAENHIFESIKYWDDMLGVHTEAYGEKLYKNGADISSTLWTLYAHKLQLFDIKVIAGSPIVDVDNIKMYSTELLNARPNSGYRVRPMVYDLLLLKDKIEVLKNKDVVYVRKMIFVLCVYKYFDYAIYILLKTFNKKVFTLDQKNNLLYCISNLHKESLSKFQNFKEKIRSSSYDLKER